MPGVYSRTAKRLLNMKELVVFRNAIGDRLADPVLILSGPHSDRELCYECVFCCPPMRNNRRVSCGARHINGPKRLGHGTNLIQLYQNRVPTLVFISPRQDCVFVTKMSSPMSWIFEPRRSVS